MLSLLLQSPLAVFTTLILLPLSVVLAYNLFFHPLARFPGPLLAKASPFWLWLHSYRGTEPQATHALHLRYKSKIVRVGPSSLSINDASVINQIYVAKGGFLKPGYYQNFDIDGHATIFTTQNPAYRAPRAKAVAPLFATNKIRASFDTPGEPCAEQVDLFIERLQRQRAMALSSSTPTTFDLVDETRRVSLDTLTAYLFGSSYGSISETAPSPMSAGGFVSDFVAVGQRLRFPPRLVALWTAVLERFAPAPDASHAKVAAYTTALAADAEAESTQQTYQSRLRHAAGISTTENIAQLKDLIFAGTDGGSTTLTAILFHLLQQPALLRAASAGPDERLLDAIVKEGLRLAMPNPARLPRLVPAGGATILGEHLPAGTEVGCASWSLHHDDAVFADPWAFAPARWLADGAPAAERARMDAALFTFGAGPRACIARGLATQQLRAATAAVARSGVLDGCAPLDARIRMTGWFNSRLEPVRVRWPRA